MLKFTGAVCAALAALTLSSCNSDSIRIVENADGGVRINLSGDARASIVPTRAGDEEVLPPIDSFWVEIYNASSIRIYRSKYDDAKDKTIRLNAGDFRLLAFHGDSLGAGFAKAYYLADEAFTVHGFADNGGEPDNVSAVARLSNVKAAVVFGENLQKYYSDYYAVLRHDTYTKKSVKFRKNETRPGYIPGGNLYLEVYAQLAGTGIQDGGTSDHLVYYRTDSKEFNPNDFVTFTVEASEREGNLGINILVDNSVEVVEEDITVPSTAAPQDAPVISYKGEALQTVSYSLPAGTGTKVADAVLAITAGSGIKEAVLETGSDYLVSECGLPASVDLVTIEDDVRTALEAAGITWSAVEDDVMGFINVSSALSGVSLRANCNADGSPCAWFKLTVTDVIGKTSSCTLNIVPVAHDSSISVKDFNIWGWKFVSPTARVNSLTFDPSSNIKLQCSLDGNTWQTVDKVSVSSKDVTFGDITGLTAGKSYKLRTIVNDDPLNVGSVTEIATEDPAQVGNAGFEEYTAKGFTVTGTLISLLTADITWWQMYSGEKWWAVNSPTSIRVTASAPGTYTDFKAYPTVAPFTDGAYEGTSVMVATIAEDAAASLILYGTYHVGELFIGTANDQNMSDWAKVSEGHAFPSRPSALSFMYKFNPNGGKPFYVDVAVYASDGTLLAESVKNDVTSAVNSWTRCTVPLTYNVTNKKAASIRLSFMSCRTNSDNSHRTVTVNTLSGEHDIHAGNILSLDNVEMLY